ncbi:MAG: cytochrome c peroxidase [Crocinitomicaceae bacterium]
MKQIILFLALVALVFLPTSGFTPVSQNDKEINPSKDVQRWFIDHKKSLDKQLSSFETAIEEKRSQESLLDNYPAIRSQFKTIEFLVAYLDPQLYNSYINGAPLPKLMKKVPEQTVIEPGGFQRLDELMFEDEIDYEEVLKIAKKLRYDIRSLSEQTVRFQLTDPVVFEAARFGILRAKTMGITGFDRPGNTDNALKETALCLEGISTALEFYEPYVNGSEWNALANLLSTAQEELNSSDFETFDRAVFSRNFSDPLWKQLLVVQQSLQIELPHQRHRIQQPVNYESTSLFQEDFLNANYYAQYADDERDDERIALGQTLFFDPILSQNNQRACASCHAPDKAFTDGLKTSKTISGKEGLRNAPTLLNSVFAERFFHDMRVDHLAAQMDHVVLNPEEFNTDYAEIVSELKASSDYVAWFQKAYGEEGITKNSVTHAVTRYVASLRSYNSVFDRYMRGEINAIDPSVIRGYNLFSGKAACATCHFAPTFSGLVPPSFLESESEVLGVPKVFKEPYILDADQGRYMNRILKEQAPFYEFSFKTPTIRNVELTAPYMHNGALTTLEEVLEFYNEGGGQGLGMEVPHQTLPADALELTDVEIDDIISFMKALTDTTKMNSIPAQLPNFEGNEALNQRKIGGVY